MIVKPCKTYKGYSASERGGVIYSHRKRKKQMGVWGGSEESIDVNYSKTIQHFVNKKGYHNVNVRLNGRQYNVGVHRLVMDAFDGPLPEGQQVRHLDNNPANNDFGNLAYGTALDNAQDRVAAGNYKKGELHHSSKLTNVQVQEIRQLRLSRVKVSDLATKYNVSISTIEAVIYNKAYN